MKAIITCLLIGMVFCGCATTQDLMVIDERIAALEMQNRESKRKLTDVNKNLESAVIERDQNTQDTIGQYAGLKEEINQIREESRVLNGQMEEIQYLLAQSKESNAQLDSRLTRLDKTLTENTERITRLENQIQFNAEKKKKAPVQAPPQAMTPPSGESSPSVSVTDDQLYTAAKQALDAGKTEEARSGFQKLLREYPKSKNADNAQFWIGETYYREKWFEKAILEYHEVIKKFPNGNKVPAALLKQGLSFASIGDKQNAKLVLQELVRKYPQTNEATLAQKKLAGL